MSAGRLGTAAVVVACACASPDAPGSAASATSASASSIGPLAPPEPSATAAARPPGRDPSMAELPAAFYMVGASFGNGDADERPLHEVAIAAFDLDRTEVTVQAYRACVDAGACPAPNAGAFCNQTDPARDSHPINCIDWHAADAYCTWAGKRLPTESEWEYAASGGSARRRFAWGDEEPDTARACYFHAGTCPVASFAPGAFDLFDMSGNVWEWTASWFAPYPDEADIGHARVYRGGSWSRRFPKWLRNTLRNRFAPDKWNASIGVRCARTRQPLVCPEDAEPQAQRCVRARGTPACESGFAYNGRVCALGGRPDPVPWAAVAAPGHRSIAPHASSSPASGADDPDGAGASPTPAAGAAPTEPISRTRDPQFDADCQQNYAGRPAAYRIAGGQFHEREPLVRASGCTKRDVSRNWTSICCAQ